jgi:hypothetical protein
MQSVCKNLKRLSAIAAFGAFMVLLAPLGASANPWNGKVVFQAFWWDLNNENYPQNWYTYLAKLAPKLRDLGFDGIWIPSPSKGASGGFSMGYDPFDFYDLGDKDQKATVGTKFGTKDQLLRLIAVAHANGLEVYPDIVLNHMSGGDKDSNAQGSKFKRFQYHGFGGDKAGRWPKSANDFHPNAGHNCSSGDLCGEKFGGPDICYLDPEHGGGSGGKYMRDQARAWMVWLKKQLDVDGFRFDAVKHFEAYVVEDVLSNSMGSGIEYFCAGEFVVAKGQTQPIDEWVAFTKGRCGTFDFSFREALLEMVKAGGFFDMGSLPNFQQSNRLKTVPFVSLSELPRRNTELSVTGMRNVEPRPDLAVPLAGPRRARQVVANGSEQILVAVPRFRTASAGRALPWPSLLAPRIIERGSRDAPDRADPLHAIRLAGHRRGRGGHQRDLLRAKGPGFSSRARNSSFSMLNAPMRRCASASARSCGSSSRSRSAASMPASPRCRHSSSL